MSRQLTCTIRARGLANFRALLCALALVAGGCRGAARSEPDARQHSSGRAPPAGTSDRAASTKAPDSALPPLTGDWLEQLELPGGEVAFVAPPIGAREPRPVLIAAHGAGDRPEWACGGWRLAARAYPFVLCPRGRASGNQRFAWASSRALGEALTAALAALQARYGGRVSAAPMIYAGFSQGAILAELPLLAVRGRFVAAVFAEGGYDVLANPSFGERYEASGGQRLLIVCGGPACFARAARARPALERSGLKVWVGGDPRAGHNLNETMQASLRAVWPELVRDLPGWQTFPAPAPP